jgi:hypothetical protein
VVTLGRAPAMHSRAQAARVVSDPLAPVVMAGTAATPRRTVRTRAPVEATADPAAPGHRTVWLAMAVSLSPLAQVPLQRRASRVLVEPGQTEPASSVGVERGAHGREDVAELADLLGCERVEQTPPHALHVNRRSITQSLPTGGSQFSEEHPPVGL